MVSAGYACRIYKFRCLDFVFMGVCWCSELSALEISLDTCWEDL